VRRDVWPEHDQRAKAQGRGADGETVFFFSPACAWINRSRPWKMLVPSAVQTALRADEPYFTVWRWSPQDSRRSPLSRESTRPG